MNSSKWKKPIWKGNTPHVSNYVTFWKTQNYGDSKKSLIIANVSEEGKEG